MHFRIQGRIPYVHSTLSCNLSHRGFRRRYSWVSHRVRYSATTASNFKAHTRLYTGEGLLPCQWNGSVLQQPAPVRSTLGHIRARSRLPASGRTVGTVLQKPATSSSTLGRTRARSRLPASGRRVGTVLHPPAASRCTLGRIQARSRLPVSGRSVGTELPQPATSSGTLGHTRAKCCDQGKFKSEGTSHVYVS